MSKHNFKLLVRVSLALGLAVVAVLLVLAGSGPVQAHGLAVGLSDANAVQTAGLADKLAAQAARPEAGLRLLASDTGGVTLALNVPDYQVQQLERDGLACQQIYLPFEHGHSGLFGAPDLPQLGVLLGVPPQAQVSLEIEILDWQVLPGSYTLCPVETPVLDVRPDGELQAPASSWQPDAAIYGQAEFWPAESVQLGETAYLRSQRVVAVNFMPFQYNPVSGQLRYAHSLQVRVDFRPQFPGDLGGAFYDEGLFESLLRESLLNYEQARGWRLAPHTQAARAPQAGGAFIPPSEPAYKLLVDQDGLYRLSYADLQAAGLPVDSLDPRTFRLFNLGSEVAIRVEGQADTSFDSGDALLFYGQAPDSEYAPENVYWLVWGQAQGLRMPEWSGSPGGAPVPASFATTQRIEENHYWSGQYPTGPDQDTWYWDLPFAYSPSTKQYNYSFSLPVPAAEVDSATLRGLFYGATVGGSTSHHVEVSLNGNLVKDAIWPDKEAYEFEVDLPQSWLQAGENTIGIYLPLDGGRTYDLVFINRFELDYRGAYQAQDDILAFEGDTAGSWLYQLDGFSAADVAVYDISDPRQPALISGLEIMPQIQAPQAGYQVRFQRTISAESRYLALTGVHYRQPLAIELDTPSDLRAAGLGADYLVISHADFLDSLAPLMAYRAAQGLQVQLVDVQEVYDNFSDGLLDPRAIRDFLAYAYANWQPAPAYVLLMGDGNYDYKDYRGFGNTNFIPPYLADVDPVAGQVATDNYFARVSGDDILPDLHIGRLPARTAQEAGDMVAKILAYEQGPDQQDWHHRILFVADNADKAGNFAAYSDLIIDYAMPESYQAEQVYYLETHMSDTAVRSAMTTAINEGVLLVSYIGHAGVESWAGSPVLFRISDLNALNNTGRYPFFVPMTCLEGLFFRPDEPGTDRSALAEVAVRLPSSGAIASWSADGYGVASGHDLLERGLFRALFEDGLTTLGPATSQAKIFLYTNSAGGYHDLIHTYHLFGDPALGLKVLPADLELALEQESPLVVTPGEWLTYTLSYTNAGPGTAFNLVITDPLLDLLASVDYSYTGPAVSAGPQGWWLDEVGTLITGTLTVWGQVDAQLCGVRNLDLAISTTALEEDLSDNQVAVQVESSQACRTFLPLANR